MDSIAFPATEDQTPQVIKKYDTLGREVLIKNLRNGKHDITAGTVSELIASLADEGPPDTLYIETFLMTFRHFMQPTDFLQRLRQRFHDHPSSTRLRVIGVLKKWAERHSYDFSAHEMIPELEIFLSEIDKTEYARYTSAIRTALQTELQRSWIADSLSSLSTNEALSEFDFLAMSTPKRIAQELTLYDLKLFRLIKPDEFCVFLWGEKNDPRISNLNVYIRRFNRIGFWVSTQVLNQTKDIKKRVDAIEKFIQIMKYCYKYQNFNTLMAILSGLNTSAMSRLKKTWEQVNKSRHFSTYKEIETKMSYRGNFKAYREIEANSKTPFIPFFGLYIKDLTFMNDGNQKHLKLPTLTIKSTLMSTSENGSLPLPSPVWTTATSISEIDDNRSTLSRMTTEPRTELLEPISEHADVEPMVNFEKCRSIMEKIHTIRVYQQSAYKFEEEKEEKEGSVRLGFSSNSHLDNNLLSNYLAHPHGPPAIENESQLMELSRECEPSERKNYTIVPGASTLDNLLPQQSSSNPKLSVADRPTLSGSHEISNES